MRAGGARSSTCCSLSWRWLHAHTHAGDGQVSFEEFAKLMMSLSAPQAPPQAAAQLAAGFGGGTGLQGGSMPPPGAPPHYLGAGAAGAYAPGFPGGLPPPAIALSSSGNPVQVCEQSACAA